jgi:small redox-active disulfide protein 2
MDIDVKILGPGCKKCLEVTDIVRRVAKENGLPAQIEKIGNTERIAEFGVLLTPALVIVGDVKCSGRVPSPADVLTWLQKTGGRECRST